MTLPTKYQWLSAEGAPKILVEALRHFGTLETAGPNNNPNIMRWASEVGVKGWYTQDSIPWCGLFIGICAKRAGYPFSAAKLLAAREWVNWGNVIKKDGAMLGDVLIFTRNGGGHVGLYIGENATHFCVYGGNQSDAVGFTWIVKTRLYAVRRSPFKIGQPSNVRKIYINMDTGDVVSTNEA